jgi:hypothetical protein
MSIRSLIDERRRRRVGNQIVRAYTAQPQTDEEILGLDAATAALINEEPW